MGQFNEYDVRKNAFEDLIIIGLDVKKIIDTMREHNQIRPIHEKIIKELLPWYVTIIKTPEFIEDFDSVIFFKIQYSKKEYGFL